MQGALIATVTNYQGVMSAMPFYQIYYRLLRHTGSTRSHILYTQRTQYTPSVTIYDFVGQVTS